MKEIEILVEVRDGIKVAKKKLANFSFIEEKRILDVYYADPMRLDLQADKKSGRLMRAFRIRNKEGLASMAYKVDHFDKDGMWIYSDEYEIKISDFETAEHIIANLGLRELVRIDNKKHIYENSEYEIVLENVKNLGIFLEVENKKQVADADIEQTKQGIRSFIRSLGIKVGKELNLGKPELMLKKKSLST